MDNDAEDHLLFPSLDVEHLRRLRAQLRTNIPGDPTHASAVSTLLGALVDQEIAYRPPVVVTRQSLDEGLEERAQEEARRTEVDHHPV